MGLNPFRPALPGSKALRSIQQELRLIRQALERLVDLKEIEVGTAPRRGGQSFRGFTHAPAGASDGSGISYIDEGLAARAAEAETTLRGLLGRDPTPEELLAAVEGDAP